MLKSLRPMISLIVPAVLMLAVVVVVSARNADARNQAQEGNKQKNDAKLDLEQSKFMRKKLEATGQILEGLTTEDEDLIIKGAKILVEMSMAEKWQVQHDVMYKQFSNDFQRSAKALLQAAEKKNFDAAALKWIDTTMKCIECHKFVRGARLADNQ
jgi:hypothetical protein